MEKKFSLHTFHKKIKIKILERLIPDFKLTQVIKKKHSNLRIDRLQITQNITIGSVVAIKEMRFFRFSCLLFGGEMLC